MPDGPVVPGHVNARSVLLSNRVGGVRLLTRAELGLLAAHSCPDALCPGVRMAADTVQPDQRPLGATNSQRITASDIGLLNMDHYRYVVSVVLSH